MRVGVVGGGVVGLATAWYLKKSGADPFVVEAESAGGGCSHGNLGWVCPSVSTPLPLPGLTWRSLAWALRRDGPLFIRPAAVPGLLPWLLRFRSHCNRADWELGIRRLASLGAETAELYDGLAADGVDFEFARSGLLLAFRDAAKADEKRRELAAVAAVAGSVWREVDEGEIREMEPMLRPGFVRGFFVESDCHVRPESLTEALAASLRARGVDIREGTRVLGFREDGRRVTALATSAGDLAADAVVLAAGARTGALVRAAGERIRLTAGKGYSVTIERPENQLRQPLYLGDARVGLTPFEGALRFGGTMELSGVNRRLDPARVRSLRKAVVRDVDIPEAREGGREWVGMRPMVPDTLPVLGRLPSRENVYLNVGHQMLGVTLAPGTGGAVAGMVAGSGSSPGRGGSGQPGGLAARVKSLIRSVPDFPIPGIRFRDVMGLVEDAGGFRAATAALAGRFREAAPEVVVAIEARGFIFGVPVAQELGAGFVPVRKAGKLPGEVRSVGYDLEYGTARAEMQEVAPIREGTRVLLIDDLVATGGSAEAAIELIRGKGGVVVGAGFVVDLPELSGAERLRGLGVDVFALCSFLADEE